VINSWLTGIVGATAAPIVGFILLFALVLAAVVVLFAVLRRLSGGTFVAGGRNRQQRLAVMDATAVDSRRRLVLVRRDEVEHLILIGGPTDVVVEQNIRHTRQAARAGVEESAPPPAPRPMPQPVSQPQSMPARPPAATAPVHHPDEETRRPAAERPSQPGYAGGQAPARSPEPPRPVAPAPAIDPRARPAAPQFAVRPAAPQPAPASAHPMAAPPPVAPPREVAPTVKPERLAEPVRPAEARPKAEPAEPVLGSLAPEDRLAARPQDVGGREQGVRVGAAGDREPPLGLPAREPSIDLGDAFDAEFSDMFTNELDAELAADRRLEASRAPDVTLDGKEKPDAGEAPSIEHEMERLLGQLSRVEKK
jgi:hypothetical protein